MINGGKAQIPAVSEASAGDPASISTTPTRSEAKQMTNTNEIDTDSFDEQTTDLMNEAAQARLTGGHAKARRLQKQIDAMFVAQYGTDPAVGSSGGRTA